MTCKTPKSWADKLAPGAEAPAAPTAPSPAIDGLLEKLLPSQDQIAIMILRRELYVAKARILELELQQLGVKSE